MPSPTLDALRAATASRHAAVEERLGFDAAVDLARYRRALAALLGFHRAWEPRVLRALPPSMRAWTQARSRHAMLERDAVALGIDADGAQAAAPVELGSTAAAMGSLYVLQGSALGGQVIIRRVASPLGLSPAHGGAYFHGWGAETGAHWQAFRALLETHVDGEGQAAACAAACATFDAIGEAFRRAGLEAPAPA